MLIVDKKDALDIVSGTLPVVRGGTGVATSTGTGNVVLNASPTLVTPNIGVATGTSFNSITGLSSVVGTTSGTAAVGTSTTAARADHVHPVQTSVTGNAGTATTLATARTIAITGDLTYTSGSFNGSANVTGVGTLANTGVTAGTYRSVTTDSKGRITAGTNPTTVSGYGLTDVYTITEVNNSLALKINNSEKGVANGVATLDVNGKVVLTQIPDSILGQLEYVGTWNFTTMPTATQKGQYWIASTSGNGYVVGDWAVWNGVAFDKVDNTDAVASVAGRTGNVVLTKTDVGLANVDNTADTAKPVSIAQATAIGLKADSLTVSSHTGNISNPHSVTKAQVGLGNVDNTSDASKPVSTAQQTALDLKANLASPTFTGTVTAPTFSGALSGNATSATTATNVAWSGVTSKPTTLSGYGITDAYTKAEVGTLAELTAILG